MASWTLVEFVPMVKKKRKNRQDFKIQENEASNSRLNNRQDLKES